MKPLHIMIHTLSKFTFSILTKYGFWKLQLLGRTCSCMEGAQFSSLLCSSWVLISTGWLGWLSTKVLVVYRPRSISHAWAKPRITVIGLCRHQSSSWGENASCLVFTWTQGVGGSSWSGVSLGSSWRRFGRGISCISKIEVDMGPEPGPTRSHSFTISLALISYVIQGVGCGLDSVSNSLSCFIESRGLILTSQDFTELLSMLFICSCFTGELSSYESWDPAALPRVTRVGRGERGWGVLGGEGATFDPSWGRVEFFVWDRPGAALYLENLILRLVSSPDPPTGVGLNLFTEAASSWKMEC